MKKKLYILFSMILWIAAQAFAGITNETTLDNVNWNQVNPWEDFLPKGETANTSAGCVPTAYAQLMAYHEWPTIIDDTVIGHGALSPESGTYIYRQDFSTPVYTKVDWNAMKNDRFSARGEFECGRLMAVVGAYSFPVYAVGGTASTVTCPHFNPWYGDFVYYTNPMSSEEGWQEKRSELFAAVKNSIEAKLPLCAGFQSTQGPHAIVIQGYREENDVPQAFCNLGWGGASNGWTSYNTNPSGKSYALTGIFANHAPRKMAQIEPLPAVSGMNLTLKWYAPKYWKELAPEGKRITGYQVEIAAMNDTIVDWADDFSCLKQTYHLKSMCDGGATTEGGVTHTKDVIKIEKVAGGNQLWLYNCPDPRYYEWPETWIATDSSELEFKGLVEYTENMDGLLQVKVANGPWTTLYDLTEGGKTDRSAGEWKDYRISLADFANKPFKLRIYVARRMRGEFNHWSWKFKNWTLKSVKTFDKPSVSTVVAPADTFSTVKTSGTYEFSVKPIFGSEIGECYRSVVTTIGSSAANSISVTYRGNEPTNDLQFNCAHSDPSVLTVTTTRAVEKLLAISGNTAIFPDEAISVKRENDTTWKVTLTPTDLFKLYKKYSNGQKLILTLAAIEENGTAAYKDLSLTFSTTADDLKPPSGGGGTVSFVESDFYLGEPGEDEWIYMIDNSFTDAFWDDMVFTCGSETRTGANLPSDAKVRIVVTATRPTTEYPRYNRIRFESHRNIGMLSVVGRSESAPPLTFNIQGGVNYLTCNRLNVQGAEIKNETGCIRAGTWWIGYKGQITVADVFLEKCDRLLGVGTINVSGGTNELDSHVNKGGFKGGVTGSATRPPVVEPDPSMIGEGGDDAGGGSTGDDISTNAQDPVNSLYHTYGYDMTEDFWDARKEAIQKKKLLFVLSGSTSCNWCHETMKYLERMSDKIDEGYVCYYAKRQNGKVPMIGGLPQYGTYDPRTIDAFTGTMDANGNFNPEAAWYSHCDNAFDSGRGFSEIKIDQCLNAAEGHTVGKFEKFTLEGPSAVFADTPTKLRLVAHFDDGVKMDVDHGVEWKVISGEATITTEGVVNVKSGEVVVQARNAFYNFNATENTSTTTLKTIGIDEVRELKITSESFNLEDDTTVRLQAEAVLKDGTKTTAFPVWTATIKEFTPLTDEIPLHEMTSGEITLDPKENGLVHYRYSAVDKSEYDGINLQDHVYHVTASLGSLKVEKDIPVYGPTRVWPYEWEIVTPKDVAPGSVIRVKINKLRYTYGGKVYETTDTTMAEFETGYAQNYNGYYLDQMTSADIPVTINNWREEQLPVRVTARKKGGKYAYYAFNKDEEAARKWVTFHPAGKYVTSLNGIRLNTGWLKIYFPDRTDYDTLVDEDSDLDGFTNAEEFLLGTDPTDAKDRWAFTSSHFDWPNEVYYRVMFMSHQFPGRDYTIEGAQSVNGPWYVLGKANGKLPGVLTDENVTAADQCRVFRVKVKFSELMDSYPTEELVIPGYGVWNGVTLNPKEDEKYAAFIVDANNLTYKIPVSFSKTQNLASPVFSVPSEQVMPGTLDRFEPAESLKSEGYRFVRKEDGLWAEFYATEAPCYPADIEAADEEVKAAFEEWIKENNVGEGATANVDAFILGLKPTASKAEIHAQVESALQLIDLKKFAEIESEDAAFDEIFAALKEEYPNAKIELVPVETLPDSPNAKFRRLKLSPKLPSTSP